MSPFKGRLLIASPALRDPNFDRTIVLMLHHDEDGAVGLVLNHPSQMAVAEALPQWEGAAAAPPVLFFGGPVDPSSAICLARMRPGPDPVEGWLPVIGRIGTLDLTRDPAETAGRLEDLRVFSGYSGWGPGQLEGELEGGAWLVVEPVHDDPFTTDPAGLWRAVLRRQPGRLAWLAQFPDDVHAN